MLAECATSATSDEAIRVFLVDDHRTTLWGLERLIQGNQPQMKLVGSACNPAELMERAVKAQPNVIVMDLDLGGESATQLIPNVIEQTAAKVLVLTGIRDPQLHVEVLLTGAMGVVKKEESAEIVLRAIECVHRGEVWMSRAGMTRLMAAMAQKPAKKADSEAKKLNGLTPREREVIREVAAARGAKSTVIAERLGMSEHTLRNHLNAIYDKLQIRGRVELFIYANANGLSEIPQPDGSSFPLTAAGRRMAS